MIASAFWQTSNKINGAVQVIAPTISNNITSSIVNTFPTTITIAVTGIPTPVFSWTKDEIPISGENGPSISVASVGSYEVTATNPGGTVNSNISTIYYSTDPIFHVHFIYYNASQCNLSYVDQPILNGYVDPGDVTSYLVLQSGNYTVQTPVAGVNYKLNDTVMTTAFKDNCVNEIYSSDTTVVFSLTRYYYNAFYNDDTEEYECKDPVEFGTTIRSVGLNDLAGSIRSQFLIDPTKGSAGNPFTHTIADS